VTQLGHLTHLALEPAALDALVALSLTP